MPSAVYAGDTLLMLLTEADYPASAGWSLTFEFRRKEGALISFTSTASGDLHSFTVAKDTTLGWIAGDYKGQCYASDGTQRFTVWTGTLSVFPDFSTQVENYDTRTHAEKVLDAIKTVLEGKATRDVLNTTIAGQSIGRMSFTELLQARAFYEHEVNNERIQAAGGEGNIILARFVNP